MRRRTDLPRLHYDCYRHHSDFRIWSLRSAYNMFSCPWECLGISVMDLCLADLQAFMAVRLIPRDVSPDFSGRQWHRDCLTWWRHWSIEGHTLRLGPSLIAYSSCTLICRPSWQQITSMMLRACPYEYSHPQSVNMCRGMHRSMGFLMGFLCGCLWKLSTKTKNSIPYPLIQADLDHRCLALETIACAVGTIQMGNTISNMEPVSLVKLGDLGVKSTVGWAGPPEVEMHHLILIEEGRQELLLHWTKFPNMWPWQRHWHWQTAIHYWVCCLRTII